MKNSLKKLALELPLADFFIKSVGGNGFRVLPVTRTHLLTAHSLPLSSPWPLRPSRLLIAQSLADGMTFVSGDAQVPAYGVALLWD
ncbi:MAG: hypothetical protein H7145_01415 [Akkermansiaceae bacterium]|nr:hypothetical protein [Armatimonadota bacterium]